MDRTIILELTKVLIMIIVLIWTRYGVPLVREVTESYKLQKAVEWAQQAVDAAQQVHKAKTGKERKAIVTDILKEILMAKNIALSDKELDVLIEAAVRAMKLEEKNEENDH